MKRIFIIIGCFIVLMSFVSVSCSAETPDVGTINSAALNYFTGVVNKLPENCNYVIFRSGDYTATMYYGYDLELQGSNIISSKECKAIIYNTRGSGTGSSYNPTIDIYDAASCNISTSDTSIIYSSLGSWASVGDTSKDNISYILWTIIIFLFLFIVYKTIRNRRHYINL